MDVSVILATYKRPDVLAKTLESFCRLSLDELCWELIIVDNADDSETRGVVYGFENRLPLTFLVEKQAGKNNALNLAIPKAKGDLFVFCDDDIIAADDWLKEMFEGAKRWPKHDVFGGRIVADWPGSPPYWGEDNSINISLFALHNPTDEEGPYDSTCFLPYGPNMAIRKRLFDQGYRYNPDIGPTNKSIYRMGSETELLRRLLTDGFMPIYLPNCIVKHQIRPEQLSAAWVNGRNFRIGFANTSPEEMIEHEWFFCARHLWKQLILKWIEYCFLKIKKKYIKAFQIQSDLYRIRGKMYAQRSQKGVPETSYIQRILRFQ